MGLDVAFQAIPDDPDIMQLAVTDDDWLDFLTSPFMYFQLTPPRRSKLNIEGGEAKLEKFDQVFVQFLRVFANHVLWGRKWDLLAYLLIKKRRDCSSMDQKQAFYKLKDLSGLCERERLVYRAMFGGDLMRETKHISARNGQTEIPRYLPYKEVREIADLLYDISFDELLKHYSDEAMEKAFLYKFHPNQKSNKDYIIESFVILRNFYVGVSAYKSGLLWRMI